jgi:hypothetical protein
LTNNNVFVQIFRKRPQLVSVLVMPVSEEERINSEGTTKNEVLVTHTMRGYSPASHYKGLVQSHSCPCVNSGGQIGNGAGSSLSTSAFPCHYHSTNAHLPHFTHLLLKLNNFINVVKQNNSLSIILDHIVLSTTYLITIKYERSPFQPTNTGSIISQ